METREWKPAFALKFHRNRYSDSTEFRCSRLLRSINAKTGDDGCTTDIVTENFEKSCIEDQIKRNLLHHPARWISMEEAVWENSSSMIPLITSPSWGAGFVSSQLPVPVTLPAGLSPKNVQSSPDHSLNIGKFFQGIIDREELDVGNGSRQSSNPVESNDSRAFTGSNRANLMVGQLLPEIGCTTGLRFSQCEDAIKFAADSALAMSGSGTTWGRALSTELPASATLDTVNTPEDRMDPNLGSRDHAYNNKNDTIIPCLPGGNSSACNVLPFAYDFENLTAGGSPADFSTLGKESIESLDCLLSITNSNDHTTMQDDDDDNDDGGISAERMEIGDMQKSVILSTSMASERQPMILNTRSVSSAGSSESPEAAMLYRNRAAQAPVDMAFGHDPEESVSQSSSHPRQSKALILDAGYSSKPKKRRFRDNIEFPTAHKRPVKDIITDKKQLYAQRSLHFGRADSCTETDAEAIACMREMIYRAAAFRPINLGMEVLERPKRKNVRISSDPQTVAARQRREKISDRIRILQRLVPGGTKMDTASMLDEAINYLKFLKTQVKALQSHGSKQLPLIPSHHLESPPTSSCAPWFPVLSTPTNYAHLCNSYSFPVDPCFTSAHGQ